MRTSFCAAITLVFAIAAFGAARASASDLDMSTSLPTAATVEKLKELDAIGEQKWTDELSKVSPRELVIDEKNLTDTGKQRLEMSNEDNKTVPFVLPNSMVIKFEATATPTQVENYLEQNNLSVIQKFENIGAVQVEADISKYFTPSLSDKTMNDTIARGVNEAIKDFTKDPLVHSATPDIFLTDKAADEEVEITNMLSPVDIVSDAASAAGSTIDWGVTDIEAADLWTMPGATDGVVFGVMDVGFARHDDLSFLALPNDVTADNHGNHVAGIACGLHNGKGIDGVLPNCFVRARAGNVFFRSSQDNPQLGFMVLFSQILSTLDAFVGDQDEVGTFNVSLGYNWRSNFGINPDLPESGQWRGLVESQGVFLVAVLEAANREGKVIFSAAGNDSRRNETPISAKYASPFNWAAIEARRNGIENGVIVAAHDQTGKRASFSNSGADISCPGVNIFSALAFDANSQLSRSSYGKMSGTSMASPYCASAHALFGLVRGGYTGVEIVKCMVSSGVLDEDNVPHLKLKKALEACPARS